MPNVEGRIRCVFPSFRFWIESAQHAGKGKHGAWGSPSPTLLHQTRMHYFILYNSLSLLNRSYEPHEERPRLLADPQPRPARPQQLPRRRVQGTRLDVAVGAVAPRRHGHSHGPARDVCCGVVWCGWLVESLSERGEPSCTHTGLVPLTCAQHQAPQLGRAAREQRLHQGTHSRPPQLHPPQLQPPQLGR